MNIYPRSFLRMIVLANIISTMPLLTAVGYTALTVDSLAQRSEAAVRQASQAATLGYALQERLNHLERALRRYEILGDPAQMHEYVAVRQEWRRIADDYASIALLADIAGRVREMQKQEAAAYEGLAAGGERLPQLKAAVAKLKAGLPSLLADANQLVEEERETFRLQAENLRQRLLAAVLTALALTGLLLWLGRGLVNRQWSRFERAVLALGEGRLDRRIRLKGPEDMQRAGSRLEWLRKRMLAFEEDRVRIVRHASHELKTPLAALREGSSLLSEHVAGPLTPQQEKIVGIMQTNSIRLQGLIDGMLRLQQASHACDHMETSFIRLDKLIEQTLTTTQLAARNRRLRITGSLAQLTIEGGNEQLATLVDNLVSNAVKFSSDGGVVQITLVREGDDAVLDVVDEGPGIRSREMKRIFEPFYRGSASKKVAGAGVGLAIAHEFALAHGGSLEVVRNQRGAHFRARLPLLRPTT